MAGKKTLQWFWVVLGIVSGLLGILLTTSLVLSGRPFGDALVSGGVVAVGIFGIIEGGRRLYNR